jgi:hypothetical protein
VVLLPLESILVPPGEAAAPQACRQAPMGSSTRHPPQHRRATNPKVSIGIHRQGCVAPTASRVSIDYWNVAGLP